VQSFQGRAWADSPGETSNSTQLPYTGEDARDQQGSFSNQRSIFLMTTKSMLGRVFRKLKAAVFWWKYRVILQSLTELWEMLLPKS
jgi:hypothetical protein